MYILIQRSHSQLRENKFRLSFHFRVPHYSSTHLPANFIILLFLIDDDIPLSKFNTFSFTSWWKSILFPFFGYCGQSSNDCGWAGVLVVGFGDILGVLLTMTELSHMVDLSFAFESLHTDFHRAFPSSPSHQQWSSVLTSSGPIFVIICFFHFCHSD